MELWSRAIPWSQVWGGPEDSLSRLGQVRELQGYAMPEYLTCLNISRRDLNNWQMGSFFLRFYLFILEREIAREGMREREGVGGAGQREGGERERESQAHPVLGIEPHCKARSHTKIMT